MGGESTKSISGLIWLTLRAVGQVLITPFLAFMVTYFFDFQFDSSGFDLDFRREMLPWIFTASLVYAMLALLLALYFGGGFRPLGVIERGGWLAVLRLSNRKGDADLRRETRRKYATSAHGRLSLLVHERHMAGHRITSTHGGLVILAIPFQILLATVPLALVLAVPDTIIREDRRLEMALLVYLGCFVVSMKTFPALARKYIGLATFTRRWLGTMGTVSKLTPFLVLFLLGRVANIAVLGSMGDDISLSIKVEKELFETSFAIRSIPETSFVVLLTALAVMPLAAFTTLAALQAGTDPPNWIYEYNQAYVPVEPKPVNESRSMIAKGAVVAAGALTTAATVAATTAATTAAAQTSTALHGLAGLGGASQLTQVPSAVHQVQQVRQVADHVPIDAVQEHASIESLTRSVEVAQDATEFKDSAQMELAEKALRTSRTPAFDEPAITGFRKRE